MFYVYVVCVFVWAGAQVSVDMCVCVCVFMWSLPLNVLLDYRLYFLDNFILILCVLVFAWMYGWAHMLAVPSRTEEGSGSLGTGLSDGFKQPCGCWELNLAPLEEQPVFLTIKSTLQLQRFFCLFLCF